MAKNYVRKNMMFPSELYSEIEQYREKHHLSHVTQAIVQLLDMGLEYTRKIEERSLTELGIEVDTYPGPSVDKQEMEKKKVNDEEDDASVIEK